MTGSSWLSGALVGAVAVGLLAAGCTRSPELRLILLVTVDTLRADELGAYGSTRGLTPQADALAGQSLVFEHAYASASFTLPSIATLLTGRYPDELGIRSNESGLPGSAPTLATELAGRGWRTAAVVGNFVLRRSSGVARGFERFDDDFRQLEAVRGWPERSASDATDAALALLSECTSRAEDRCFLWVHYQDPHGPYDPPGERRQAQLAVERAAPDGGRTLEVGKDHLGFGAIPVYQYFEGHHDLAWYRAGYRAEIGFMDEGVGRLLAAVDAAGLRGSSAVVFVADHGEALGEQDVWFSHGALLDDALVRVPLLLRIPGRTPARREDLVSLRDVYPTLLNLASGRQAPETAGGRDLLAPGAEAGASEAYLTTLDAAPQRRFAIVADGFKFIATERDGVFDGRLHRIGREDVDLGPAAPQLASELRRRLEETRSSLGSAPETLQQLDEAEREQLRALGYAEPEEAPRTGVTASEVRVPR